MKTDKVEIFQTIRALLQPYTTKGFVSRTNSETLYDLWSEKQVDTIGEKNSSYFFASIELKDDSAILCVVEESGKKNYSTIERLDREGLDTISNTLVKAFANFKHKV